MNRSTALWRLTTRAAAGLLHTSPAPVARCVALIVAGILCGLSSRSLAANHALLADLRLEDLSGHPQQLHFGSEVKAVVFLFVSVECPISNSYAPEVKRLGAEFGPKNVIIELVYPNIDESTDAVRTHLKEFGLPFPAWRDPRHDLVKASGVHITPEAAVLVPKVGFVYHGRIDDRYAALGVARPQATQHDLREVLTAIAADLPIPHKLTPAVGCSIGPLPSTTNAR